MGTEDSPLLAFFSYARHDSTFALQLAGDLREHGAPIWLDQLDIDPGQHWDSSIEEALANCPRMLLILSPDSVASTNVMDEVSFALEEHKIVIPVLHRDCKIPFRLRRVQYIDLRTDYKRGLHELLRLLHANEINLVSREEAFSPAKPFTLNEQKSAGVKPNYPPPLPPSMPAAGSLPRQAVTLAGVPRKATGSIAPTKFWIWAAVVGFLALAAIAISQDGSSARTKADEAGRHASSSVDPPTLDSSGSNPRLGDVQAAPVFNVDWLNQFLEAFQGPDVNALRPYFNDVVAPYYTQSSANWDSIAADKRYYFNRFPKIDYALVTPPNFDRTQSGGQLSFGVSYRNVRNDGVQLTGTAYMTVTLVWVDGAWKISGIEER